MRSENQIHFIGCWQEPERIGRTEIGDTLPVGEADHLLLANWETNNSNRGQAMALPNAYDGKLAIPVQREDTSGEM
jgi:hypothetical protein